MSNPVSYLPTCHICNKPIKLEMAKTDESGRAVHEGCYLLKVMVKRYPVEKAKPLEHIAVSPMSLPCPQCNAKPEEVCEILIGDSFEIVHVERIQWAAAMDAIARKASKH
jgi:hypothetical protein